MATFDVLIQRFATRIGATAKMTLETLSRMAVHVLAQVRPKAAANGANAAAHHRRAYTRGEM